MVLEVIKWLVTSNGLAGTPGGHCDSTMEFTLFVGSERVRNQLGLRKCVGFHIISHNGRLRNLF